MCTTGSTAWAVTIAMKRDVLTMNSVAKFLAKKQMVQIATDNTCGYYFGHCGI